jgi:hypothetical protein
MLPFPGLMIGPAVAAFSRQQGVKAPGTSCKCATDMEPLWYPAELCQSHRGQVPLLSKLRSATVPVALLVEMCSCSDVLIGTMPSAILADTELSTNLHYCVPQSTLAEISHRSSA